MPTIRSAITVCPVPESRSGPFVLHDGLGGLFRRVNSTVNRAKALKVL